MDESARQLLAEVAYDSDDRIGYVMDVDGILSRGVARSDGIVDVEWIDLDTGDCGIGYIA